MLSATAAEMTVTDQPNSARSGAMSTPGTARKAAAPTRATKVTAATHHAGWMPVRRGAAVDVTPSSMADRCSVQRVARQPTAETIPPPDVMSDSPPNPHGTPRVWKSGWYRRRPRSSESDGLDVGARLRHLGAPATRRPTATCDAAP